MQLRLGRSRCHAEHLGDLFVFVAFYVVEDEDAARSGGEAESTVTSAAKKRRACASSWGKAKTRSGCWENTRVGIREGA